MPEFRQFGGNCGLFESPTYLIRIDNYTHDGIIYWFRALFWDKNNSKTMADMSDLILSNGEIASRGQIAIIFYFIENDIVYVIAPPVGFAYGYKGKGELLIGEKEHFTPSLYEKELVPILMEEIEWAK